MAARRANFKLRKHNITKYMFSRRISQDIQLKVIKYLNYIEYKENEKPDVGLQILDEVSSKIREEVFLDYYGKVLQENIIFNNNFTPEFI